MKALRSKGSAVTTKEIARAAGVAEGTIFRVFTSKDELIDAAVRSSFDPRPLIADIERIDLSRPLRTRLVEMVTMMQDRFVSVFSLMGALGMIQSPERRPDGHRQGGHHQDAVEWRDHMLVAMVGVIEPDRDRLRIPPQEFIRYLRLLTFSGSHEEIADHRLLTPEEIVSLVLDGTLVRSRPRRDR